MDHLKAGKEENEYGRCSTRVEGMTTEDMITQHGSGYIVNKRKIDNVAKEIKK